LQKLPPDIPIEEIETRQVLKKLTSAHSALAELKGTSPTIPNENILIDTLSLQEAKDSSAIENIVTTHDELYRSDAFAKSFVSPAAKEVYAYSDALKQGFEEVRKNKLLTVNTILKIQEIIEENDAGIRKQPGTMLKDGKGNVVYEPPQDHDTIVMLLNNLEWFMNEPHALDVDPLVKMAFIHHQFESIHPFYDGNGRTGRIVNILYLVITNLLDLPILYLSRYIIQHRQAYYKHLQDARETSSWESWILYMLDAIETTSRETTKMIGRINELMAQYKHDIRNKAPKIYSQDLINNLFRHPYTQIAWMAKELNVNRMTATRYLDKLADMGKLRKVKMGRKNFYINEPLFELLIADQKESPKN
jgi:Fic family protein